MARSVIKGGGETLKRLVAFATENGWEVRQTNKNHLMFSKPGYHCVTHSYTSSDHRAWLNTRAKLRRAQRIEA